MERKKGLVEMANLHGVATSAYWFGTYLWQFSASFLLTFTAFILVLITGSLKINAEDYVVSNSFLFYRHQNRSFNFLGLSTRFGILATCIDMHGHLFEFLLGT
jgi:hypothetical protein